MRDTHTSYRCPRNITHSGNKPLSDALQRMYCLAKKKQFRFALTKFDSTCTRTQIHMKGVNESESHLTHTMPSDTICIISGGEFGTSIFTKKKT